jgi:hypothetical protein
MCLYKTKKGKKKKEQPGSWATSAHFRPSTVERVNKSTSIFGSINLIELLPAPPKKRTRRNRRGWERNTRRIYALLVADALLSVRQRQQQHFSVRAWHFLFFLFIKKILFSLLRLSIVERERESCFCGLENYFLFSFFFLIKYTGDYMDDVRETLGPRACVCGRPFLSTCVPCSLPWESNE